MADRKTGNHGHYGADDGLAAGKARADILRHGVGDPSAVKGRDRIAAEHAEADHGHQGRETILLWDEERDDQRQSAEGNFHVTTEDDKALFIADAGAQQGGEQLRQSEEVRGRGEQGDKGAIGP